MPINDRYYQAALDHVNRVRAMRDLGPIDVLPAGRVRSFAACPIARGVGGIVASTETCVCVEDDTFTVEHEPDVNEFIQRFDKGFYPELDGRLTETLGASLPGPLRRSDDPLSVC